MVAVNEELLFRGVLHTHLEEVLNPTAALILSSAIFGLMHVPQNGIGNGIGAALGGAYMAYRYQKSNYDLGETIAFHFWIDFSQSVINMIRNPRDGTYVYTIVWKM
jgi:membrane protease YdiL (CAAX protease family)